MRTNDLLSKATILIIILSGCFMTSAKARDKNASPYFVVLSDADEKASLPLKSTDVDVNVSGVIADVTVNQTYVNTGKSVIEAIYVFPASTRAAVYKMVMKVGDRIITAKIEEKDKARKKYEKAKKEGKTASLLEEKRPNVFKMNVANIVPGATVEVKMSYTELLVPSDKIYEFVYPTVVGPRYVSKGEMAEAFTYVSFVIDTDGSIIDVKIARGISPSLDAEAIRVVKSMPKWKPGRQRGKAVQVSYTVPINFVLEKGGDR